MRKFSRRFLSQEPGKGPAEVGFLSGKSLLKSSTLAVGSRVMGAVFGVATQILLARILSAEDLGNFFIALSVAMVLGTVSTLGYPWIVPTILARAEASGRPHRAVAFLAWARQEVLIFSAVLAVIAILIIFWIPFFSSHTRLVLAIGALTAPVFAYSRLKGAEANAHRKFALAYLPDLFWRPLLLLGLIVALWAVVGPFDLTGLLLGHLVITIALTAEVVRRLSVFDSARVGHKATPGPLPPERRGLGRKWRARALPMVIATLFIGVFADLDLLFAGMILSEAQIGIFGVCIKISMFLAFAIQAVHQVILRDAADALYNRDRSALDAILFRANLINVMVSLSSVAGVALLGQYFLALFGPEFVEGSLCLLILTLAQTIRAAAGPATQILALSGHVRASVPVFAIGLILLLLANLALVPPYGLIGAALAVLLVTAIWTVWLSLLVKIRTGLDVAIFKWPLPAPWLRATAGGK